MRKRLPVILVVLLLALCSLPVLPAGGDENDISITYRVTEPVIDKGDYFTFRFTLYNNSGVGITGVTVSFLDSAFTVQGEGTISAVFEKEYSCGIKYEGGSNRMRFAITYTKGGYEQTIYKNITIKEAVTESGGATPVLALENGPVPTASPGDNVDIPLIITNTSNHQAKNIRVKLSVESGGNPFDLDSVKLEETIGTLDALKSQTVFFSLRVNPAAGSGTYPLRVDFTYSNQLNQSFTGSDTVYVRVENGGSEPALVVKSVSCSPSTVEAGDKVTVSLTLANVGDKAAKAVRVSLVGLNNEEFTLLDDSDTRYVETLGRNRETTLKYSLLASEKMAGGNHPLGIRADYKDEQQNKYSGEYKVFIKVEGKGKSDVAITNIVVTPQEVKANESFSLVFIVKNNGKTRAENVKVSVKGDEGIFSKSPDIKVIGSLAPGQSHTADFLLFAGDQLQSKNYNIQISLEYEDPTRGDAKVTVNQYTGVYVNGSNSKLIPKIIINSYRFDPMVVRAGEKFSLEMSFLNTSSTKAVSNIKVFLTGIDADKEGKIVFTPVGSSNTFFIDSIKPKGVSGKSLILYTIPDAEPRTYTVTANFEYQDEEGTEYKATELIGIPVIQQSKINAGEINLPPEAFVGQPVPISVEFYNTGKTKLSNLMIRVEGDFEVQEKQSYIGNFDSGSYDYFETSIIATEAGLLHGKLVFTFDDPSGEVQEYVREFTVNAVEAPSFDPSEGMPFENTGEGQSVLKKAFKNKSFWTGLAAGLIAAAAVIGVSKRIRRKKSIEFDE